MHGHFSIIGGRAPGQPPKSTMPMRPSELHLMKTSSY